ncbi:MAG: DUF1552 domain-containing protein [Bryobacterales bacterium]|nr:DUF1552 domain-containing protein [Bryobacterales bacterium]
MIVTGKHLPRRTFLRGLGAAVALPWLDAMVPAFAAPAQKKTPVRLVFGYVPNGMMMRDWTPKGVGKDFEFSRILKPLEPFREDVLILTGLHHRNGEGSGGDHARASATYLTGVAPKRVSDLAAIELGISVDQIAAQAIGSRTRLPSLELGCEATRSVGACDGGFSCAYMNNMSFRDATTPVPPETNPRAVFERLYGSFATDPDPKVRERLNHNRKSMLDFISADTERLTARLGAGDRQKLDEYLTSLRDIEKRIARAEKDDQDPTPAMDKPLGVPSDFLEHAALNNDMLAIALQADLTRVASLIYAKEASTRSYPELGFADAHHPLTHHRGRAELIEKATKIQCHHLAQFASLVKKLKAMQEGEGTVLDHSMLVYGSSMSDPNAHLHYNVPCVLVGRGDGSIKPGRHVVYPGIETPQTNLWLTLLDKMGVQAEKLGDSTGKVDHLTDL